MNYLIIVGVLIIVLAITTLYYFLRNIDKVNSKGLAETVVVLFIVGCGVIVYAFAQKHEEKQILKQVETALSKGLVNYISVDNETNPKKGAAKLYNDTIIYFDIVKEDNHYYVQNIKP